MASTQSVDRFTDIIDVVAENPKGKTLSEIVTKVNLPKTTVHRTLNALVENGYIMKDASGLYTVGYKFLLLAKKYLGSLDIREVARPFLRRLVVDFSITAHIAVLQGNKAVYIEKLRPFSFECTYSDIGKIIDLYCSGLGKSLLLGVSDEVLEAYLNTTEFKRYTRQTLDKNGLRQALALAREQGYTVDNQEHEEGAFCIAMPIYDYTGAVIAAISMSKPDEWLLENGSAKNALLNTAYEISKLFGASDNQ